MKFICKSCQEINYNIKHFQNEHECVYCKNKIDFSNGQVDLRLINTMLLQIVDKNSLNRIKKERSFNTIKFLLRSKHDNDYDLFSICNFILLNHTFIKTKLEELILEAGL